MARWTWRDETVNTLIELRKIDGRGSFGDHVLGLHLDMTVSIAEHDESRTARAVADGHAGVARPCRRGHSGFRTKLRIEASLTAESDFDDAPDTIREVAADLKEQAAPAK